MLILGIESSCDETAIAVVRDGREILSSEVISQADMHALYGGVVPEIASRNHIEVIEKLTALALTNARLTIDQIDAVAVTYAPGLIGALLVGINFAKALAFSLQKPLIPVHHMRGHIAANYLAFPELTPPFVALCASGGHTLIVDVMDYTEFKILGTTRDDAAGEAFDKVARVLGLGYPGGAKIDALAAEGDPNKYTLPRAKIDGSPMDMSFSGIKTAVINLISNSAARGETLDINSLCASFSHAICDMLVPRCIAAVEAAGRDTLVISGGVSANKILQNELKNQCKSKNITLFIPPLALCGDNAAMIAAEGYYEFLKNTTAKGNLNGVASLSIEQGFMHG